METIPNTSHFYTSLTPRKFEELLHDIYYNEIQYGRFKGKYEEVFLKPEGADQGIDVDIYQDGQKVAGIQCKRYRDKISKTTACKEIIKFCLFHLVAGKSDFKNSLFHYHFACINGFTKDTPEFLFNFSSNIIAEPELEKWTNELIKTLSTISKKIESFSAIEDVLKVLLKNIRVELIQQERLDYFLAESYNNQTLISKYWEVRTVIIEKSSIPLTTSEILQNFQQASFPIIEIQNTFGKIPNSNITRRESLEILNWIDQGSRSEKSNICLVVGGAGDGKSVIIRDLYDLLAEKKIPTLGIKSDLYTPSSNAELEASLNFKESIEGQIKQLLNDKNIEKVVLLIDQLDALSQTQSNKRDSLNTFRGLINNLKSISKLKIVISVREFDLQEDSDLHNLKEEAKKVTVSRLSLENVQEILSKTTINFNQLSQTLKELLQVPQNLDILCRITDSNTNFNLINTRQDLQEELFTQKVIKHKKGQKQLPKCVELIYHIADKMYKQGGNIPLSIQNFKIAYNEETDYLISENLFTLKSNKIQFFHQSFYEFVFAKAFVAKEKDLLEFIIHHKQSIRIRSIVKMVMDFLRDANPKEYHRQLNAILINDAIAFHFKHLLIANLGFVKEIMPSERKILTKNILPNLIYKKVFLESVNSYDWFDTMKDEDIFNQLLNTNIKLYNDKKIDIRICSVVLSKFLIVNHLVILEYAQKFLIESDTKAEVIPDLLINLKDWNNTIAFRLFEAYISEEKFDDLWYCEILKNAFQYNTPWCFEKLGKLLLTINKRKANHYYERNPALHWEHSIKELLEYFFQQKPTETLIWSLQFTHQVAIENQIGFLRTSTFLDENGFSSLFLDDLEGSEDHETFYGLVVNNIRLTAMNNPLLFRDVFVQYLTNPFFIIQRVLIKGLLASPVTYPSECFLLINTFYQRNGFNLDEDSTYWLRELILKSYSYLGVPEQNSVNEMILMVKEDDWYQKVHIDKDRKVHFLRYYGKKHLLFLSAIPLSEILQSSTLRKRYHELLRKHSQPKNNPPRVSVLSAVPAPYSQKTYQKMSLKDWEKTIRYINTDEFLPNDKRSSIDEHSREFEKRIGENPAYFFPLIKKLVEEWSVHERYIIAGLRGLNAVKYEFAEQCFLILLCLEKAQSYYLKSTLIDLIGNLLKLGVNNSQFIDHLSICCQHQTTKDFTTGDVDGWLTKSINTLEGKALWVLMECEEFSVFYPKIKETIKSIADGNNTMLHTTIMAKLSDWLRIDIPWTRDILFKITDKPQSEIYKYSVKTINYLNNSDFEAMLPYYEKANKIPEVLPQIANVLFQTWIRGQEKAYPIFMEMATHQKVKSELISISSKFLKEYHQFFDKALFVYEMFVEDQTEEVSRAYSMSFLQLPKEHFTKFIPFLEKYARNHTIASEYYYDYLFAGIRKQPVICLELLSYFHNDRPVDVSKKQFYHKEKVLQLLLSIYSVFIEVEYDDENSIYLTKAIRVFDEILKNDEYRAYAYHEIIKSES